MVLSFTAISRISRSHVITRLIIGVTVTTMLRLDTSLKSLHYTIIPPIGPLGGAACFRGDGQKQLQFVSI